MDCETVARSVRIMGVFIVLGVLRQVSTICWGMNTVAHRLYIPLEHVGLTAYRVGS